MPLRRFGLDGIVAKLDLNDVSRLQAARVGFTDRKNLIAGLNEAFGPQEAGGQFLVVAGSPHGDYERFAAGNDLQRLFGGEHIAGRAQPPVIPLDDEGWLYTSGRRIQTEPPRGASHAQNATSKYSDCFMMSNKKGL